MGRGVCWSLYLVVTASGFVSAGVAGAADFKFDRDTLAFANSTVFAYQQGRIIATSNPGQKEKSQRYTRRCFVMSRTALQFYKFARFDPNSPPLDDQELQRRIRAVTHRRPWLDPAPPEQRIVFPSYHNLREMSQARPGLIQKNIGLGWPTYARPGNFRMAFLHGRGYQEKTHRQLEQILAQGNFFIAYLSDFPVLHINHSVLVYTHKAKRAADGTDSYLVYDPNHPDGPRELKWVPAKRQFEFQKDQEFVGGFTRVFQVYGRFLQ